MILNSGQTARVQSARAVPASERWNAQAILVVRGTPNAPNPTDAQQTALSLAGMLCEKMIKFMDKIYQNLRCVMEITKIPLSQVEHWKDMATQKAE